MFSTILTTHSPFMMNVFNISDFQYYIGRSNSFHNNILNCFDSNIFLVSTRNEVLTVLTLICLTVMISTFCYNYTTGKYFNNPNNIFTYYYDCFQQLFLVTNINEVSTISCEYVELFQINILLHLHN
jgi:hypothetical protein